MKIQLPIHRYELIPDEPEECSYCWYQYQKNHSFLDVYFGCNYREDVERVMNDYKLCVPFFCFFCDKTYGDWFRRFRVLEKSGELSKLSLGEMRELLQSYPEDDNPRGFR